MVALMAENLKLIVLFLLIGTTVAVSHFGSEPR